MSPGGGRPPLLRTRTLHSAWKPREPPHATSTCWSERGRSAPPCSMPSTHHGAKVATGPLSPDRGVLRNPRGGGGVHRLESCWGTRRGQEGALLSHVLAPSCAGSGRLPPSPDYDHRPVQATSKVLRGEHVAASESQRPQPCLLPQVAGSDHL